MSALVGESEGMRLITERMIAQLRRNVQHDAWAAEAAREMIARAASWRAMRDEELWGLMFGPTITRAWMVNNGGNCPACGGAMPMYNWRIDWREHPWKVACAHCAALFPTNDFAAFYQSGLDEHGVFAPARADRTLLFNTAHPDPDDPLHQFGVDDGEGYCAGDQHWHFIGAYLIYGRWKQQIRPAITALAEAYVLTNETIYAHKAAILLDRVADLYPLFDFARQSTAYTNTPAGDGYVTVWHDACEDTREMALAYALIRDALPGDTTLIAFLAEQARQYALENPKTTGEDIRRNIEERILRDALAHPYKIHSNYPRGDIALAVLTGILDPKGARAARATMHDVMIERATRVDGVTGEKGLPAYSAYTIASLADYLAQLSREDPESLPALLARHPRLRQTYRFHLDTWCMQNYYPNVGDGTGFAQPFPHYAAMFLDKKPGLKASLFTFLLELYHATGDPAYVQALYHANGHTVDGLPYDLFAEDPAAFRREVAQVIAAEGAEIRVGSVNKPEWSLAILRGGSGPHARALWLDYDIGGGHAHADGMNLGLFAKGLDLLPDCGYPQVQFSGWASEKGAWFTRTAAHNTVLVDGKDQGNLWMDPARGKTTLWADGEGFRAVRAAFLPESNPLPNLCARYVSHIGLYAFRTGRFSAVKVWTRAVEADEWTLQFVDNFQRAELGPDWKVSDGDWRIENGEVVGAGTLSCTRNFPGCQWVEYDARSTEDTPCDLSALLACAAGDDGVLFGFGSNNNAGSKILVGRTVAAQSDTQIVPGQFHHVSCLCEPRQLRLLIDGELAVRCVGVENPSLRLIFGDTAGPRQYERTAAMIDISPEDAYILDVFRVTGGHEHARFFHSYFGAITTAGLTPQPGEEFPAGTLLRKMQRDPAPQPGWQVDWRIDDHYQLLPPGADVHLRHTDLTHGAEALLAEGWVNGGNFNVNDEAWIPTIITRRRAAAELASTFVAIIEPYEQQSNIKAIRRLPVHTASGAPCADAVVAVEVELADGRRDLLIATDAAETVHVPAWQAHTDGALSLVRRDAAGKITYLALCQGSFLAAGGRMLQQEGTAEFAEQD